MKANLNTNLLPIINVGMYESPLDSNYTLDPYIIEEDLKEGYIFFNPDVFSYFFNNDAYVKTVRDLAEEYLTDIETKLFKIVEVGEIYSPKYYNFSTDNLEFTVEYNKTKIINFAHNTAKSFNKFLKENYTSYDGFLSYTSNNFNDWLKGFNNDNEQEIGAILRFILEVSNSENHHDSFYQFAFESILFYTDYIDNDLQKIIEEVNSYIKQNSLTVNKSDMIKHLTELVTSYSGIYSDDVCFNAYIDRHFKEVDSHTMKLEL